MPKPKPIGYEALARKLQRAGYFPIRKSRHTIYYNPLEEITVPIPHNHPHDVPKGLMSKIIKEMGLTVEEFNEL